MRQRKGCCPAQGSRKDHVAQKKPAPLRGMGRAAHIDRHRDAPEAGGPCSVPACGAAQHCPGCTSLLAQFLQSKKKFLVLTTPACRASRTEAQAALHECQGRRATARPVNVPLHLQVLQGCSGLLHAKSLPAREPSLSYQLPKQLPFSGHTLQPSARCLLSTLASHQPGTASCKATRHSTERRKEFPSSAKHPAGKNPAPASTAPPFLSVPAGREQGDTG